MATPTPIAIAIAPSPTPPRPLVAPAMNRAASTLAPSVLTAMASLPASATPVTLDDRLPTFTTREATLDKVDNRNALVFSVPTCSSLLLKLVAPLAHTYEKRDLRWLHLLQGIAVVPSRKADMITQLATQALQLIRSPVYKQKLDHALRGLLDALKKSDGLFSQKALLALRLKDKVAEFLREWVRDPVDGFVLRQDHVVGGMRLDDLVATPVGAGYLRGYRPEDQFCVVVFPWGHGFVHRTQVEKLDQAIEHERKKRHHNEYLALEHQHLYEQVESLLENYVPVKPSDAGQDGSSSAGAVDGVDMEQYTKLLAELQAEHYDPEVLEQDLNIVRRVQNLVSKLSKRQRTQSNAEEEEEEKDANDESVEDDGDVNMTGEVVQAHRDDDGEEEEEVEAAHGGAVSAAVDAEDDDEQEDNDDEPME